MMMMMVMMMVMMMISMVKEGQFLFFTSSILSSTSLIDILPRNTTATVRYLSEDENIL